MSDKKNIAENSQAADSGVLQDEKQNNEQPLPVHNPLDPGDSKQITQEDIANEQKYKEALSERD